MVEIDCHRRRGTRNTHSRPKSRNSGVQLVKNQCASGQYGEDAQYKPKISPHHREPKKNHRTPSKHHRKEYRAPRNLHRPSSTTPHSRHSKGKPRHHNKERPRSRPHGERHGHGHHEQPRNAAVGQYKSHSRSHPSTALAPVTPSTPPTKGTDMVEMELICGIRTNTSTPTVTGAEQHQQQHPPGARGNHHFVELASPVTPAGETAATTSTLSATTIGVTFGPTPLLPPGPTGVASKREQQEDDHTVKERSKRTVVGDATEEQKQLTKLRNFVEHAIKSGLDGMEKSWRVMADYLPPASTRIDFDENPEKNRFQDMVCVDQSRVFLEGAGPDYIHASWVPIGDKDKKCIITQLPLPNTTVDFWEMCMQNRVQGILLILTQFEFEKFAARAFLPGQGDFIHFDNHMKVGCLKVVEVSKNWSLHLITVKQRDRQRYFHLHHYKDWQHGKKPGNLDEIWQIESAFRRYNTSPHVYVSLSGCGRAGTYGAFQLTHQYLHDSSDSLNVTKCVKLARNHRMHAVQSAAQYQFICVALLKHILAMKNISKIITDKGKFDKTQQIVKRFAVKGE
ncbi:unnamed protein product, partial [Mesorhabditis belari]|uniref:Tyrosine-protein phosphatase domain-containing protein n=1 Tax=Mesorhabditis belari TaxID=2138241 RepID=A0AAF3F0M7_9BILA